MEAVDSAGSNLEIVANDSVTIQLDRNADDSTSVVRILNSGAVKVFKVDESGDVYADRVMVHSSDVNRKERLEPVDSRGLLNELASVPIWRWSFKGQETRHLGPTAQDFFKEFGLGHTDTGIATVDAGGVALAAIQGLYELVTS